MSSKGLGEVLSDDEEDNSSRFPYPLHTGTLNRTNSEDVIKDRFNLVDKEKNGKFMNLVKTAQSNTKSFLGIDNYTSTQHDHSVEHSKSLSNWNERVFKVMNSNPFFGGELKERKLDDYVSHIDSNYVDDANPFLYYKLTGQNPVNLVPKITVANMAVDGLKKLTKRKPNDTTMM